ncbi:alpha-amylase family glycosyl hydrolase [Thermodesulfobacteriota bacterium]
MKIRKNPHIYEINLMPWLEELSLKEGHTITLDNIPRGEWRYLKSLGMDIVWLMGMWQRSPYSKERAINEPALKKEGEYILSDFSIDDIEGSPYAVYDYIPDPRFGSKKDLLILKEILEEEDLLLFLDFVPNHTACDHQWIYRYPSRYIIKEVNDEGLCQEGFFLSVDRLKNKCVAHGKDPYFPPWTDTAQINYARQETVDAMTQTILDVTVYCHGLRCDMAMLSVKEIFLKTWNEYLNTNSEAPEFWPYAIDRLKSIGTPFFLMAEVYWEMGDALLDYGFNYVYDKHLYDLMLKGDIEKIRERISSPTNLQEKMVRFLENHDEPRAFQSFGPEGIKSAMIIHATLPGMRFWHHGQLEGRRHRVPVQLRRAPKEIPNNDLISFGEDLLKEANHAVFHEGEFKVCSTNGWPDNNSHINLIAYSWEKKEEKRLIIINFSPFSSQGYVKLPEEWAFTHNNLIINDPIKNENFKGATLNVAEEGLYVGLEPGDYHFFNLKEG